MMTMVRQVEDDFFALLMCNAMESCGGRPSSVVFVPPRVAGLIDHMCWMEQTVHQAYHHDVANVGRLWTSCTHAFCLSTVRKIRGPR